MLVTTKPEVNVRAIMKGSETYILMYDDTNEREARRCLGRMAMDPRLSFTWVDAARLAATMRRRRSAGEPTRGNGTMPEGDDSEEG